MSTIMDGNARHIHSLCEKLTSSPEDFLRSGASNYTAFKQLYMQLYSACVSSLPDARSVAIKQLIVDNFDDEQVWQQVELLNNDISPCLQEDVSFIVRVGSVLGNVGCGDVCEEATSNAGSLSPDSRASALVRPSKKVTFDLCSEADSSERSFSSDCAENEGDSEADEDSEYDEEKSAASAGIPQLNPKLRTRTCVDDKFFNIGEMEQYLQAQDDEFMRDEKRDDAGDDCDMFGFNGAAAKTDDNAVMYADFFDPPHDTNTSLKHKSDEPDCAEDCMDHEESGNTGGESTLSSWEKRQLKLREHMDSLEEENLREKPWHLRGETRATERDQDALLHQHLDFEQTKRAPVITADVTAQLEKIILARITDQVWDDVERKVKPIIDPYDFKKRLVFDQEKSKYSLAEIYEQEYNKQKAAAEVKPDNDLAVDISEDVSVPQEHKQIRKCMATLFSKLDALTNLHYVPKQPCAEIKVVSNLASIALEEKLPAAVSNSQLLAPEEIKRRCRAAPMAKDERSETDRKRERRHKKRVARARTTRAGAVSLGSAARSVTKVPKKTGKKSVKSSSSFFSQLQQTVDSHVKARANNSRSPAQKAVNVSSMKL